MWPNRSAAPAFAWSCSRPSPPPPSFGGRVDTAILGTAILGTVYVTQLVAVASVGYPRNCGPRPAKRQRRQLAGCGPSPRSHARCQKTLHHPGVNRTRYVRSWPVAAVRLGAPSGVRKFYTPLVPLVLRMSAYGRLRTIAQVRSRAPRKGRPGSWTPHPQCLLIGRYRPFPVCSPERSEAIVTVPHC